MQIADHASIEFSVNWRGRYAIHRDRYFLASGLSINGDGISQYAVGQKGTTDREGTFRDAEDGVLSGNPIAQGKVDATCDSSIWGLFAFGMYKADDARLVATMDTLRKRLWVKTRVGGMARYEDDPYQRVSREVVGNPWFICTLWLADFLLEKADSDEGTDQAVEILLWVTDHALPALSEPDGLCSR
nr:hypothetical protein [Deltaproteobacteria bacterium]